MAAIGVLTIEIEIHEAQSLKDKRRVVKSLKDRLRNKFNVSVAETGDLELWNRSILTVVTVSKDRLYADQLLQAVEKDAADCLGPGLTGAILEWLS